MAVVGDGDAAVVRAKAWLASGDAQLVGGQDGRRRPGFAEGELGRYASISDVALWANGMSWGKGKAGVLGVGLAHWSDEALAGGRMNGAEARALVVDAARAVAGGLGIEGERGRLKAFAAYFWEVVGVIDFAGDARGGIDVHVGDPVARELWRRAFDEGDFDEVGALFEAVAAHVETFKGGGGRGNWGSRHKDTSAYYDSFADHLARGMLIAAAVEELWNGAGPFGDAEVGVCGGTGVLGLERDWDERDALRAAAEGIGDGVGWLVFMRAAPLSHVDANRRSARSAGKASLDAQACWEEERLLVAATNRSGFVEGLVLEDGSEPVPSGGLGR